MDEIDSKALEAILSEMDDRGLLNGVDEDLHTEIAEAIVIAYLTAIAGAAQVFDYPDNTGIADLCWREIDLSRGYRHEHPDISSDKLYLVKVHGGWFFGPFTRQWYGWNFARWGNAGCQFDAPGYNSSTWERIIEIDPEALSAAPSAQAQEADRHG